MVKAYSIDLRQAVISYVEGGGKLSQASKLFGVTTRTIYSWKKRKESTGDVIPRKTGSPGKRKIDYDKLLEYVKDHPDATLHEMARVFEVWPSAIEKALKKMDVTRKKNRLLPGGVSGKARGVRSGD